MSWTSAVSDLRTELSDGPTDKLRAFKTVFGTPNGVNTIFKTFEFRRLTDFSSTATAYPLGLYLNGARLAASAVTQDDPDTGYFTAASAYDDSALLTATYYIQWFKDTELQQFLTESAQWIASTTDYTAIGDGLVPAALKYACHVAYTKLALRQSENILETYRLQSAPDDRRFDIVKAYQDAAKQYLETATQLRDDFYTRKGQFKAPLFGSISGNIKNPTVS